jgi:hypothetical protein
MAPTEEYPHALFSSTGEKCTLMGKYGGGCFLVCNGPSLLDHDLSKLGLPGVPSMSLNNGIATLYQAGVQPTFWACVDSPSRFVRQVWCNPSLVKFVPTACADGKLWDNEEWKAVEARAADCPNTWFFRRVGKFEPGAFLQGSMIAWGNDAAYGGGRTVMLAALRILHLLGFSDVYVIGADLQMTPERLYHFDEGRTPQAIRNNEKTFSRLVNEYLPAVCMEGARRGFRLWTCGRATKASCLPYVDFSEAIGSCQQASGGPFDKVETRGMYVKRERKLRVTREQAEAITSGS